MSDKSEKHPNQEKAEGTPSLKSRRQLLANVIVPTTVVTTGAALPTKWLRPVVETVVLPAHAQTTNVLIAGAASAISSTDSGAGNSSLAQALRDELVAPAHALPLLSPSCFSVLGKCISFSFSGGPNGQVTGSINGLPDGTGTLDGYSLPASFQIGPLTLTGTFNETFTQGSGTISNCSIPWDTSTPCSNAPATTTLTSTCTASGTDTCTPPPR